MAALFSVALAPMFICAFYIYIRDKYEKEPFMLLITGVLYGVVSAVPIVMAENYVTLGIPNAGVLVEAFYLSFFVAAMVEEFFKFVVLFFLTWKSREFNEPFDGIVYAVFISLGFAGLENVLYVLNPALGGMRTAVSRAIFSVPGHAFFGVAMGYYFAMAKFVPARRWVYMLLAFCVPWFLHGVYDFILLSKLPFVMPIFVLFCGYLWASGFRKMQVHAHASPFRLRK